MSFDYESIAKRIAARHGVPSNLVLAVIKAESGGNPNAVSPVGAVGLMQLMPATAADMGVSNPKDPEQNIEGGVKYLKILLDRYHDNVVNAIAAYNWGMGHVDKLLKSHHKQKSDTIDVGLLPYETRNYIHKINGFGELGLKHLSNIDNALLRH
ncbi:MAG: lytic transglycosylase domain-containing protein [Nitrospirae bacterium]|nr:lytic transglycosylase domain-containing protein [Nitrospirota bacterium]